MSRTQRIGFLLSVLMAGPSCVYGNGSHPEPCSEPWYKQVEAHISSGDGAGHGPDLGSDEWKHVVEFKLGIRDDPRVPDVSSAEWCDFIDQLIDESTN